MASNSSRGAKMTIWSTRRIESTCAAINRSLEILAIKVNARTAPFDVETSHFAQYHPHSSLMRKLGIISTVRRGGGPGFNSLGRNKTTTTTYRISRLSITPDNLRDLLKVLE